MTRDDSLAAYLRNGESLEQALSRLGAVVDEARDSEVIRELNAAERGSEILSTALKVFGTQAATCAWLMLPAISLNGRCPIDIVRAQGGTQVLLDFLGRLENGLYS